MPLLRLHIHARRANACEFDAGHFVAFLTEAEEAAWSAANQFEEDAFDALVTLPPVTVAGMRAAIEYFAEFESDCIPGSTEKFLSALLKSPLLAVWPLALKHDGRRFTLAAVLF